MVIDVIKSIAREMAKFVVALFWFSFQRYHVFAVFTVLFGLHAFKRSIMASLVVELLLLPTADLGSD